ncbi:conserved Plasmodium protein, unknown function [Plasmodium knowlesi strain H]|uniref:Uncharacterized protein n=3 Tax=Plasmodium knowlesi TaxID=5850 RepID=A0A5K1TWI9_PLAKH|nr:conserved Plasmodium protein, unknown function [Plasmodium knowlesi strain H]OTN65676.1 Uncharacterized protein PKNOH_S110110900 [Plasmodium knowlesi]CAA9989726.1 conserved Plasmodium protein, unknown function [Plasmodium knowlesi strain H]SBO22880.1 conserved Plasmodium protein, unknown function [Plasmodium knowlesi strain H]SBO23021.1 conserved Plasmodium protein, unknown function [Plasmodium knowlesi strain H]VVS79200.1 conserved Plasmodium protein, unknown function [Plasmodium knowlesi |eukprot:XP_002260449.1 hypothetical protein, conserved in Plasmodium species [Plasmodium knowlesi strain H]
MHKCVNVDSLNDDFITKKDSLKSLSIEERSNSRIAKSHYGKNDADIMKQNAEKNYLDHFDAPNGNLNKNYIYSCDNLMDEYNSRNSNLHSRTLEEHLKSYSYHMGPEQIRSNKYGISQERVDGKHLLSLSEERNMILSRDRINKSYFSENYDNRSDTNRGDSNRGDSNRSSGNRNKDQMINMISNHYNNLIRTTNKGIENINSNCDAIISNRNYDSMSDVSSIILMNKNDTTQSNNDYADYNYNSYFNYRNDHTSAYHYNNSANNGGENNGSRTRHNNGGNAGSSKRYSNGYNNRAHRNGNYEGEKRECFTFSHESSLNENLIPENCDYAKVGKAHLEMPDNELNSLPLYNDEETPNRILQEMGEQTKQGEMHFTSKLQSIERENTNNRIKIYDIFNNSNIKKSNNNNMGILNFLKNKRTNKYTYDSKGIRNDAPETKDLSKESYSSGVSNKVGGIPGGGIPADGHPGSGHSNTEGSQSNYRFNDNMRNVESIDPYNGSSVLKGCTYNDENTKNKLATPSHILISQKYIQEKGEKASKAELANKSNINSFETLKHLEKGDNGDVTNLYGATLNGFLNKKDNHSDECSNKTDVARKEKNNPFSMYHYVKKERTDNVAPLSNEQGKGDSSKSGTTSSKDKERCNVNVNINGGSSKINRSSNNVEQNYKPINSEYIDNHDCGSELPTRGEKANKKGPITRDAATNSNDYNIVGKRDLHIYKTELEVQKGSFNHYAKKGIKKDALGREHRMNVQKSKPDKDHHYFKEGIETEGEFPMNEKWNGNDTYYVHEENRRNEKIKTNEELSSKYISSYSDPSLPSSIQSSAELQNRIHEKSRNSKIALTKGMKSKNDKRYNEKKKMDLKGKQENEQFHRSRSNSLTDDISCIYEEQKQSDLGDVIGDNRMSRNGTCRHIVNDSDNCKNANKNNKGVGTDAIIPGQTYNYDEAKEPLQQNSCKHECRNAPMVYVKKKKKNNKMKHKGSDRCTESCTDRGRASSRDEDKGSNECKDSLNGEDSSVRSTNRRSNSPNVTHWDLRNGFKRSSGKYPGELNNALKELRANNGDNHCEESERKNGRDNVCDHLVVSKVTHSMNPFRHNVTTNPKEDNRGSNECDSGNKEGDDYNNRDRCDRNGKYHDRGRDKKGHVNILEKSQISQECNENCVTKRKEKKKKKEGMLKSKQTMAQDEDMAHGDDTNVFVKCRNKNKSSYIISDYEQRVCFMRENVSVNKTHFVAPCKKMHQTKKNTSKKCCLKKSENQSSSSFNSSSYEKCEEEDVTYDNKTIRTKCTRLKENNMKKTHRTPLHSNTTSIRNMRGTNRGNDDNSQSGSSNLRCCVNDISNSSDDLHDGERKNANAKTGRNRKSNFPNREKIELKIYSGEGESQKYKHQGETLPNGMENRDSNSDSDAGTDTDYHVGKSNRPVSNIEKGSHFPSSVSKKKKRKSNLAQSKNDKQQDLPTRDDNTDCDNIKEKEKRKKMYSSTACSNTPTNGSSKLVYNTNGNQSVQHDRRRPIKKGDIPDGDEQICANVQHESENFSSNANDVTMRGENMCTRGTNIDGSHINDPRMGYADISTSNYKTHSSKNSMDTIDNPTSVGSLNKKKDIQLMNQCEEIFGYAPQGMYPNMRYASMGGGNTNHMDAHFKNMNLRNHTEGSCASMINGNEFSHERVNCQNGDSKILIMAGDITSCGDKVPPMEEQRIGGQLAGDSIKQNTSPFYEQDIKVDEILTHNNKGELLRNSKHMLNGTLLNVDSSIWHNPQKEHKMKEKPTEHNPFKGTKFLHNIKKTENNNNRISKMYNEDNTYNSIYMKGVDFYLKDSVRNHSNGKSNTLVTVHGREKNDEGLKEHLNTNTSVNINYNQGNPHAYESKNTYMGEEQIFPGENYNNVLCRNRPNNDDKNDEILREKGKSHLFSSRGEEVDNIYRRDSISNVPVLGRGAPPHVTKSIQSTYRVCVNNTTQEKPQSMEDPYSTIYYPVETHTNANCYIHHPNFFQKETKAAQRCMENNPFSLHSSMKNASMKNASMKNTSMKNASMKSASMDGGIKFYKMDQTNTMSFTPPVDRESQNKEYDACEIRLFDKAGHSNVIGGESDGFVAKNYFEKNASGHKRRDNMEGEIGAKGSYGPGDSKDERRQMYMHTGRVAPFSGIYPSSSGPRLNDNNGVNAQNGNGLLAPHGKDTTVHCIRKNNAGHNAGHNVGHNDGDKDGHNDGDKDGHKDGNNNGRPFVKGMNIHVSSALNEADKKGVHVHSQVAYPKLESAVILNEVLQKNNENWNKPYSDTNKIPTLHFTNNFSIDFANILKNYKDKSDNYLNKQYIQDLERIHFLIQDFTNNYRCSDNLKSIFQLLQYEFDKEKREHQYFCQNQKYVVLTMPLNDIKKNYDKFGEPSLIEPISQYKLDTCLLENLDNQSKGKFCSLERNHLKEDLTDAYNLVKNCSRGDDPKDDSSDYDANDKCVEKCTTGNSIGLYMRTPSYASSQNSTTDMGTSAESVVVHTYSHNGDENTNGKSNGKQVRTQRCIGNLPKTDKMGKYCISKKRWSGNLNESILSKMNIFLIRHNNRVYKFKLNSNFAQRGNQLYDKKNGKFFKLLSSFYEQFLKEKCNKRNVLLNGDISLSYVNNDDPRKDNLSNDQTDNEIAKSSHTNNEDNFYNIIQSSGLTNIDDLFISDDEVNLIYMYSNHRNEKIYSLEKLDVLTNQNSILSTLNDSTNTGHENYACKK